MGLPTSNNPVKKKIPVCPAACVCVHSSVVKLTTKTSQHSYEPPCGYQELNPSSLQEQQVLLPTVISPLSPSPNQTKTKQRPHMHAGNPSTREWRQLHPKGLLADLLSSVSFQLSKRPRVQKIRLTDWWLTHLTPAETNGFL